MADARVSAVKARREVVPLPTPLRFGPMTIRSRSYCIVDVELTDGRVGSASTLDRNIDLVPVVVDTIAGSYMGERASDVRELWHRALRAASPTISSGAGLRALSLVDIAVHNATPYRSQTTNNPAPVWVIVGYPPDSSPEFVRAEAVAAVAAGASGVKLPVSSTFELTRARLAAAAEAIGDSRVAIDLAWSAPSADDAARVVDGFAVAWLEDPFPPGSVRELAKLRAIIDVPLASGDEDTQLYHPMVLLDAEAVDIVRLDATCQGGITRMHDLSALLANAHVSASWHMSSGVHARLARELSFSSISVEISSPGAGVDPLHETTELMTAIHDIASRSR